MEKPKLIVFYMERPPWILKFDGTSTDDTSGACVVIISPISIKKALVFNLNFPCINNQKEYEALIIGLEILKEIRENDLTIFGDSQLVIQQMNGEHKCSNLSLAPYFTTTI